MADLTDTQLVLLGRAAQREDHALDAIDKRTATRTAIEALLKGKLLKLVPKGPAHALWVRSEDGEPLGLVATPKGLKALGVDEAEQPAPDEASGAGAGPVVTAPPSQPKGKLGTIIDLMRRESGATIADMMALTGWQAHSVRGAISGAVKKKLGLVVSSSREGESRTYRIGG